MRQYITAVWFSILLSATFCLPAFGQVTAWNDVYSPLQFLSLNVELTKADYDTIQADETFDIKVPAFFWMDGDADNAAYNITIRRKSATPIGEKISYRIAFVSQVGNPSVKLWYDIKSLSLENGDDQDVVSEGLAWYLHRRAANEDYKPGLAAWVSLTMHVVMPYADEVGNPVVDIRPQGVYLNVELPDKRFLQHRGLWFKDKTWLYKQDDIGLPELKDWPFDSTAPEHHSPAYQALDYSPFRTVAKKVTSPTPSDAVLGQELNQRVNMEAMLHLGAVNAFVDNPDELFNHAKNHFWADFSVTGYDKRIYFPWDLDASIRNTGSSIYGTITGSGRKTTVSQHPYQKIILNHPEFRLQYNDIMTELLDGPLAVGPVQDFLFSAQEVLTDALLNDPNNRIGNTPEAVAAHFDDLRAWIAARHISIRAQLENNGPPAPRN